jgi:predicted amidophosphoribosyltransferase
MSDNNDLSSILQTSPQLQKSSQMPEQESTSQMQPELLAHGESSDGIKCASCGTINDMNATYCASCGASLDRSTFCPRCGAPVDIDADYCENCHHYIKNDVCSFCGAQMSITDVYCPECGSPRGGIECPACHTLNMFSFCRRCGTPLTEEARQAVALLRSDVRYMEVMKMAEEYSELERQIPLKTEDDERHAAMNEELRRRVLTLLEEDRGVKNPIIEDKPTKRMTQQELDKLKGIKCQQLNALLEQLQTPPQASPAKARNYAMASRPIGVRMGWLCNYKHALHSGPTGCAKPQLGGKWVVVSGSNDKNVTDDIK